MKIISSILRLNSHYFIGLGIILLLYLFIDLFLGLTNWGVILKVLLYENSVTSRSQILNFIFPLISFEQNLGFSILAESQAGVFEPIKLFFNLTFGSLNHINLTFFSRLVILYSSIFLLLKDGYKLSNETSILTALFAVLSPTLWNDAVHQFHLGSFYLLPISIYFVEKFLNSNNYLRYFIAGSIVLFLQLLAGHFHYQLICLIILTIYALITILFSRDLNYQNLFKIFVFFFTLGFGFCLAAIQIIPTFELMLQGDRSNFNTTFQGSLSLSGILLFYKTLSKLFNNVDGSLGTLGYITIFIYTINQFFHSVKKRKVTFNKIYIKYSLIFLTIYLLGLGEHFSLNNIIFKAIPFLESFRAPARFMQINSFCTLILFAVAFEELKKSKFKIENLNFIFIIIIILFVLTFFHFSKFFHLRTDVDLGYWRHVIVIFYPFLIIIFTYLILNQRFLREKIILITVTLLCISIFENVYLMNRFAQYSVFFEKKLIKNNIIKAEELCKKYKVNSLNIVGEFKETEIENYYNFKNYEYYSPISSANCKVFYHHNRLDLVKRGMGYNQSSLVTYQMANLSDYQYKFLKENFDDFFNYEFKYIASFLQNFTNAKVFYVSQETNKLEDDLFVIEDKIINNFIKGYSFKKEKNIFDNLRANEILSEIVFKNNYLLNFFPSRFVNQFKLKKLENQFLLPIWQDDNFYIKKDQNYSLLKDLSFGKKINLDDIDKQIFYIPISFIFGLIISIISLIILFLAIIFAIYRNRYLL